MLQHFNSLTNGLATKILDLPPSKKKKPDWKPLAHWNSPHTAISTPANPTPHKLNPNFFVHESNDVKNVCVDLAIEFAKKGRGGLIVLGNTTAYECMFPNFFEHSNVNVFEDGMKKVLMQLMDLDGAVIVAPNGSVKAYGARILHQSTLKGFGTRHSAANGISQQPGVTAILVSEEHKTVKIFRNGIPVCEIPVKKESSTHQH